MRPILKVIVAPSELFVPYWNTESLYCPSAPTAVATGSDNCSTQLCRTMLAVKHWTDKPHIHPSTVRFTSSAPKVCQAPVSFAVDSPILKIIVRPAKETVPNWKTLRL